MNEPWRLGARGVQRILGAREDFRHGAGVAWRDDAADRDVAATGPAGSGWFVAHTREQSLGGDRQFSRAHVLRTTPNLLPEKRPR